MAAEAGAPGGPSEAHRGRQEVREGFLPPPTRLLLPGLGPARASLLGWLQSLAVEAYRRMANPNSPAKPKSAYARTSPPKIVGRPVPSRKEYIFTEEEEERLNQFLAERDGPDWRALLWLR